MDTSELHVHAGIWKHCLLIEQRNRHQQERVVLGCARTPARSSVPRPQAHPSSGAARSHSRWPHLPSSSRATRRITDLAVLVMEGEAPDNVNGGPVAADALHRAARARGLPLATDLDHLAAHPVRGWRVWVDHSRRITLEWPHIHPLLHSVPLDLPAGWLDVATEREFVVVFAGHGLQLHGQAACQDHWVPLLRRAAEAGALAAGAVTMTEPTTASRERAFQHRVHR